MEDESAQIDFSTDTVDQKLESSLVEDILNEQSNLIFKWKTQPKWRLVGLFVNILSLQIKKDKCKFKVLIFNLFNSVSCADDQ